MAHCPNCHSPSYQEGTTCFRCGVGPQIGPGPSPADLPQNIKPGTPEHKEFKRQKAYGRPVPAEEFKELKKILGIQD